MKADARPEQCTANPARLAEADEWACGSTSDPAIIVCLRVLHKNRSDAPANISQRG